MSDSSTKIQDFVRLAVQHVVNAVLGGDFKSARVRFTGDRGHMNFVWIMVDRCEVRIPRGSSNVVDGLWAHTNDFDFMAGSPLSFEDARPFAQGAELVEPICEFLAKELAGQTRVELLMQADSVNREFVPNLVGNSDDGFANIREQAEFPSV